MMEVDGCTVESQGEAGKLDVPGAASALLAFASNPETAEGGAQGARASAETAEAAGARRERRHPANTSRKTQQQTSS